ncbi:MAG: MFS transporter [Synechococcales bacterium]|nr:MFS transporter [Synechococcales bacterium]
MVRLGTQPVLWLQVWSLAGMQGAIVLTWVIYNLYLPKLLANFGFPAGLAITILLIENVLAAVMEPLMGGLSDRTQRNMGTRFPFIALGIILSSGLFIAIPGVVFAGVESTVRGLLPWVAVFWALAMTLFRSPAMSLLGRYAFATQLPQAVSILTLVGAVAGAIAPLANQQVLQLGPTLAFGLGAMVLLISGLVLRSVDPQMSSVPRTTSLPKPHWKFTDWVGRLGLVAITGFGVAIGFRLMLQTFPQVLELRLPDVNSNLLLGLIFLAIAATAIPAGNLTQRIGNFQAMLLGLGALSLTQLLTLWMNHWVLAIGIAILMGAAFSLVSNGTLPFALSMVPPTKAGLGTGIYFSGGSLGTAMFFSLIQVEQATAGALLGALAFLLAAGCVALSYKMET